MQHTAFVPDGAGHGLSRRQTAVLLVGTADEHGIDQHSIKMVQGGFRITEELADVLYSEPDYTEGEIQTSGDRAEKNDSEEE